MKITFINHITISLVSLFSVVSLVAQEANTLPKTMFAKGLKEAYEQGDSWDALTMYRHKNRIVNFFNITKDIKSNDTKCDATLLGYQSLKVEKNVIIIDTIDLTKIDKFQDIAILVDDHATLTIEGLYNSSYKFEAELNGTAIWKRRSFKTFTASIPPGAVYRFTLSYNNTANLTTQYKGAKDVDGVAVYLYDALGDHSLHVTKIPEFLFGAAKYATPITFKCHESGDESKVQIEEIKLDMLIDEEVMKRVDIGQRFVAVIDGKDSYLQKNGSSDEYTCFVRAQDIYDVVVPKGQRTTDKFRFRLHVTWKYTKDGKEHTLTKTTRIDDQVARVFRFADRDVFAMDLVNENQSRNTRKIPIGKGQYNQDIVDKLAGSGFERLAPDEFDLYKNDFKYPHFTDFPYGFNDLGDTAIHSHKISKSKIDVHTELYDDADLRGVDNNAVMKSYVYGCRRGGYLFVSYGGKKISVLDMSEEEYAMDLNVDTGSFEWGLFEHSQYKLSILSEKIGGLNLGHVSGGLGIVSIFAGGPWSAAFGVASSLIGIYTSSDIDDPLKFDRAHAAIMEVSKVSDVRERFNIIDAKVNSFGATNKAGAANKYSFILRGNCRVGEQWVYFVDINSAVTAKARNYSGIKVSAKAEFWTNEDDFQMMKIKIKP